VAYCLKFLENSDTGVLAVKHLLDTFQLMVSLQTSFIAKGGKVRDVNREDCDDDDALQAGGLRGGGEGGHAREENENKEGGGEC